MEELWVWIFGRSDLLERVMLAVFSRLALEMKVVEVLWANNKSKLFGNCREHVPVTRLEEQGSRLLMESE